jgi:hemerythrin-like metal-binding protein
MRFPHEALFRDLDPATGGGVEKMPTIRWVESFEIGHERIDREHRELLEGAMAIEEDLDSGRYEEARERCRTLRGRLESHFVYEERLLTEIDFPRIEAHLQTHEEARRKTESIFSECCENCAMGERVACVTRWCVVVLDHVLMADLDFKSHFQNRSLIRDH